jgi:hypothetical protein
MKERFAAYEKIGYRIYPVSSPSAQHPLSRSGPAGGGYRLYHLQGPPYHHDGRTDPS